LCKLSTRGDISDLPPQVISSKVADKAVSMQCLQGAQVPLRYFYTLAARQASRFYNPKISQTIMKNATKNLERSLQYELERQKKEQLRRGPRTLAKNPILYDNRRTKVFNRQFQENIGFVMASIPDLQGKGISLTKVNVTSDFSEVRVFWVSSPEQEEVVSNLLESHGTKIKQDIKAVSGLGFVPRIQWIHDQNFVLNQKMDQIFEKVRSSEIYLKVPQESTDVWKVASESLELESDGCGLDRDILIGKIETEMNKKQALHRSQAQYSAEDFQTVYRETINRNGLQNKIQVKNNIRKFLTSRKKMLKNNSEIE